MHSYQRAIAVALATFGASVVGMALQLVVPAQVLADSKGTVGAMVGLITLLLALVLASLSIRPSRPSRSTRRSRPRRKGSAPW
jgi:hypothetical protein